MSKPRVYTRLARSWFGVASYASLWVANDHLMIVSSTGYNEAYARVMLRDIKAIFVTETPRRLIWNLVWLILAAAAAIRLVFLLLRDSTPTFSVAFLIVAVIALSLSTYAGAGCRVTMITDVQTTRLPALVRRRKTRKVLARLQPLITAAQAELVAAGAAAPGGAVPEPRVVAGSAPSPSPAIPSSAGPTEPPANPA